MMSITARIAASSTVSVGPDIAASMIESIVAASPCFSRRTSA